VVVMMSQAVREIATILLIASARRKGSVFRRPLTLPHLLVSWHACGMHRAWGRPIIR